MLTGAARIRLLVVTCIALFMAMLDNLVLGVALPSIQQSFHAGFPELEWFMNAYTLSFSVLLIPFGMLGERFGRKKVFLAGIAVFVLGSMASALSTHALGLTLARALQGAGSAAIMPISLTLVNMAFPPKLRAAAIGLWSGVSGLGLALGPLVGGLVINGAPWQAIFWINVPVGAAAIVLGALWLKESAGERRRLDIVGLFLIAASLFGIVFGLVRGNEAGWGAFSVWGSMAGGILLLLIFLFWEQRHPSPIIQLSLFRNRNYSAMVSAGFWQSSGIFGAIFLLTLFLQQAQGYSALEAGVREMVWTGAVMLTAPLAGIITGKLGARPVLLLGLAFQAGALLYFAGLIVAHGAIFSFGYMAPAMAMAGVGMGLSMPPLSHGLLSSVPEKSLGEASGIGNATRELGGVFGIAIGSLVFQHGASVRTAEEYGRHLVPALYALAAMILLSLASIVFIYRQLVSKPSQAATSGASESLG